MKFPAFQKPLGLHPAVYVFGFIFIVVLGVMLANTFIVKSYNVTGLSMEPTLRPDDRLIVNKLSRTVTQLFGGQYVPARQSLVVFKNPLHAIETEKFIVKRVVGLPGDRVTVHDGRITVFNEQHPDGFNPDIEVPSLQQPTSGEVDRVVPEGEIFVAGDNRPGSISYDSRNGMSTVPIREIEGVVLLRIWPLDKMRWF